MKSKTQSTPDIRLKRSYEPAEKKDGQRILVDALWPRGVSKEALEIALWPKSIAPSARLRKWFGHDPQRWEEFQRRYFAELNKKPGDWQTLLEAAREKRITLIFSARDVEHNNAVALKKYLLQHQPLRPGP